uniref:L1 transposable element RRM domain-containing protein n=1 Tax=Micrurus carvalhoi TaxID=3147026 RepID=A0A2H6MZQ3_9SAUR
MKIIEEQAIQTEKKIEQLDQKIMGKDKETEEALNHLEMDKASYYLRFQNVEEDKEENLALVMAGIIAELLQREKNEIINELDDVYRVFTSYARQHRLPREVHIRFARRQVKDIIYKNF